MIQFILCKLQCHYELFDTKAARCVRFYELHSWTNIVLDKDASRLTRTLSHPEESAEVADFGVYIWKFYTIWKVCDKIKKDEKNRDTKKFIMWNEMRMRNVRKMVKHARFLYLMRFFSSLTMWFMKVVNDNFVHMYWFNFNDWELLMVINSNLGL